MSRGGEAGKSCDNFLSSRAGLSVSNPSVEFQLRNKNFQFNCSTSRRA